MEIGNPGQKIADHQKPTYAIGFVIGLFLYFILLYFNEWNPVILLTNVLLSEFSIVTGVVMRFLSGLGITLTYVTICVLFFRILSPTLKNHKSRISLATSLILIPALILGFYSLYKISGVLFSSQSVSFFEILSTILGIWSLMVLVYILPTVRGKYTPDLEQTRSGGVQHKVGEMKFAIWKGYQSRVIRNYGKVAEVEFERYGSRLLLIRIILSGLLLLPISFILIVIPPLAIFGMLLWFRVFSLDYKLFSGFERGLLVLVTTSVAVVTTIQFFQPELVGFHLFFDTSYGFGLLTGLILLFAVIFGK
ncbi:MAG: hypothetical protein ACFFCP_16225 [Promethearchaeota archaeon]